MQYLDREVQKFASFQRQRSRAIEITNRFLFVVARLMDDLYDKKKL